MRPCSWAHLEPVWSRRVLRWASSNELHCGQYGASVDCFVLFHCDSQQVVVLTPLAKQIKEWDTNIQAGGRLGLSLQLAMVCSLLVLLCA